MAHELRSSGAETQTMTRGRDDEITVGELATMRPASTRVLYRHGIEFCAGASRRLRDACRDAAVDPGAFLADVAREEASGTAAIVWSQRPIPELVDHLVGAFHSAELRAMRQLDQLLADVVARQPELAAARELAAAFGALHAELTEHMAKEENVLFPWLRSGRGDLARTPIQVMMMEHEATLRQLNHVRALRQALLAAGAAHATPIVEGLCELDRHVREHMHLENNILFPRALRGEHRPNENEETRRR
jgi:regulator of cell morphogenesis and NO signaling